MKKLMAPGCALCNPRSEAVLWRDPECRIILADEPGYPGYCRVILERHMSEMSDLTGAERAHLMQAVFATEAALREVLVPDKINLASLGNMVPHLHWHIIPRYVDDPHFPLPIWAAPCRTAPRREACDAARLARALTQRLG